MLLKLHIRNYVIINEVEINFANGLNIITGETGAGKSILMGALNLILGERADSSVLLNNNTKCFIEGFFNIDNNANIISFLTQNELPIDEELVIRREIAPNGKSRAFINDTPTTLQQLKTLTTLLVDLHQQFDTLELSDNDFQRNIIDALANNAALLNQYQNIYTRWTQTTHQLQALIEQKNNFNKEADYHQFLYDELSELHLQENEIENTEAELNVLNNTESIKLALQKVYFTLSESEQPLVATLKNLYNTLQPYTKYNTAIQEICNRIHSTQIELQDIAAETENIDNNIQYDAAKIESLNNKLALAHKLLKKHQVKTTQELITIQQQLEQKLQNVLHIDEQIQQLQQQLKELEQNLQEEAKKISNGRKQKIEPFTKQVNNLLAQVGMPNAQIKVVIEPTTPTYYGIDKLDFLFDANKSNKFEPIKKVASGGELSRLMLCIKSLVAQNTTLATLIFDEIDTGISGEAAKQVGILLKQLAQQRQIICITHQPQIAAKGNAHYFVYKEIINNSVHTNIRLLNNDEKIIAIAKMLSGEKPSAAAVESAKEMMN